MKKQLFNAKKYLGLFLVGVILASSVFSVLPIQNTAHADDMSAWLHSQQFTVTDVGGGAASNYTQPVNLYYNVAPIAIDGMGAEFFSPATSFNGTDYIGILSSNGSVGVETYNENTNTLSLPTTVVNWANGGEDHAIPNVSVIKGSGTYQYHVLFASSNQNLGQMAVFRSNAAGSISGFTKANGGNDIKTANATYPQILEMANGKLLLFYRYFPDILSNCHWYMQISTDQADTWSAPVQISNFNEFAGGQKEYLNFFTPEDASSNRIDIAARVNYNDGVNNAMVNAYHWYSPDAGVTWKRLSDNATLTLPISQSGAGHIPDQPYATPTTNASAVSGYQYYTYLSDLTDDLNGHPYITIDNSMNGVGFPTPFNAANVFSIIRVWWNGSSWQSENITSNGAQCLDVGSPSEAMTAPATQDPTMSTVYLGGKGTANMSSMQKWQKVSGSWTLSENITQNSPGSAFRAFPVRGATSANKIQMVFNYSTNYTTDTSWNFQLFAYPGITHDNYVSLHKSSRTDFGDIRFTESDNTTTIPAATSGRPWLADLVSGWAAVAWDKIGNVPLGGSKTVTMMWGNPAATNVNDQATMDAQFYLADDFNEGSLDTSKWQLRQGLSSLATLTGGYLQLTGNVTNAGWYSQNATNYPAPLFGEMTVKLKSLQDENGLDFGFWETWTTLNDRGILWQFYPSTTDTVYTITQKNGVSGTAVVISKVDQTSWHTWSERWTSSHVESYRDFVQRGVYSDSTKISQVANTINIIDSRVTGNVALIDYIFVRPITYPLPSTSPLTNLPSVSTGASSVSMDKNALASVSVNFTISSLGDSNVNGWVDYGLTLAYGSSTANVSYSSTGVQTVNWSATLIAGQTYHYRVATTGTDGTVYGSDATFTLTMPSVTTGAASITKNGETSYHFILNGGIPSMGVASSTYYGWRWGYDPAAMNTVINAGSTAAIGSFSTDIGNIIAGKTVYSQMFVTVGSVTTNGAVQADTGAATGTSSTSAIIPLLVLIVGIVVVLKMMANGQVSGLYGLLLIFVVVMITVAILTSTNIAVNTP